MRHHFRSRFLDASDDEYAGQSLGSGGAATELESD